MTSARIPFEVLKVHLQNDIRNVCAALAPGGSVQGGYWVAPNPTRGDDKAGSFKVWLTGPSRGCWKEFDEGGAAQGDVIDLVRYALGLKDNAAVHAWVCQRYGLADVSPADAERLKARVERDNRDARIKAADERRRKAQLARRTLDNGVPISPGSVAWKYLTIVRRIPLARLRGTGSGRPNDLFVDGQCFWVGPDGQRGARPAMLAAMRQPDGTITAAHRTYLQADGQKIAEGPAKKMLGAEAGTAVRVWLGDGATDRVLLTEGIEDALSCACAAPNVPCFAVGSVNGLAGFKPPEGWDLRELIVFKDNDKPGSAAARGFDRAMTKLCGLGLRISVASAPKGRKDANDMLKSEG